MITEENERNFEGGEDEEMEEEGEGEDELVVLDPSHVRASQSVTELVYSFPFSA